MTGVHSLIRRARERAPGGDAIRDATGATSYAALDALCAAFQERFEALGVRRGDRVGVWGAKSARVVAALQGALRAGAVGVPLDPLSPAARVALIAADCGLSVLVVDEARAARAKEAEALRGAAIVALESVALESVALEPGAAGAAPPTDAEAAEVDEHDPAFILYTSGSTGVPKGVCLSHRNLLAVYEAYTEYLGIAAHDRLANHSPLHFDFGQMDLHAAFGAGACVSLVPEDLGYSAAKLVQWLRSERPTVWASVPSVLAILVDQGALLDETSLSIHTLVFGGEIISAKHLRDFRRRWPDVRVINLYGPTEANYCTVTDVERDLDASAAIPIGRACAGNDVWLERDDGSRAEAGETGEVVVAGPSVMLGYWGQPFDRARVYRTGDLAVLRGDGALVFSGRRDQMIKLRGRRVELGEIEAALREHPWVREVAVVVQGEALDARLVAFVVPDGEKRPSLLELKSACAKRLPAYMVVDRARYLREMPKTRNGKTDRKLLSQPDISLNEAI